MIKESATHCNAVWFSYVVVSDYFWLCGLTMVNHLFYLGVLKLRVFAL
jgi:hypothetical protein